MTYQPKTVTHPREQSCAETMTNLAAWHRKLRQRNPLVQSIVRTGRHLSRPHPGRSNWRPGVRSSSATRQSLCYRLIELTRLIPAFRKIAPKPRLPHVHRPVVRLRIRGETNRRQTLKSRDEKTTAARRTNQLVMRKSRTQKHPVSQRHVATLKSLVATSPAPTKRSRNANG